MAERSRPHISILFLLISSLSSHLLLICASDDRLTQGKSISPNETIVSDGEAFALGFFSPTNSAADLYVGIWYNNIPQRTVIWVANRNNPLTDSSGGSLTISADSNLILADSKGKLLWSSNSTAAAAAAADDDDSSSSSVLSSSMAAAAAAAAGAAAAVLLKTGNLVLRAGSNPIRWQSFDHPTDTFIPGMKLQLSHRTRETMRLTSWKTAEDPSFGEFSLGADPNSALQMFTWRGPTPYTRSLPWAGNLLLGARQPNTSYIMYLAIIDNEDEMYMTFGISDGSSSCRFRLDPSGTTELLSWNNNIADWSVLSSWPNNTCDAYGLCGQFGYCDSTESVPKCMCLQGFKPDSVKDWNSGNYSRGCRRIKSLGCGDGDGLVTLGGMKLPDKFVFLPNRTSGQCEAECFGNCSCTAYAFAILSTSSQQNISRCLVWMGELIDAGMQQTGGENLYLRLADVGSGSRKKQEIAAVSIPVIGVVVLISFIYAAWKFRDTIKCARDNDKNGRLINSQNSVTQFSRYFSGPSEGLLTISFETLALATDSFSDTRLLGKGGFGKVYKGKLQGGEEIAVKRLIRGFGQGLEEFKNEVVLIAKLQHRNLVRLLGCCIQGEEKLLVYEYMPNKSLDAFLFDYTKKSQLDWGTRFKIIKGVGRGLVYLHQDSRLTIIHRDLKASNILLDDDMNAKISDFGMARIFGGNQDQASTNRVVGTYGYMSPEYAMEGLFSVKSDVYSFGVLLLEIVSGLRNSSINHNMGFLNLLAYEWKLWEEGRAMEFIDPTIAENCSAHEALRCIHVGLLCVQDNPIDRPTMPSVVFMLENGTAIQQNPKQPVFTALRNFDADNDHHMHNAEGLSINNVTLTMTQGR